MLSFDHHESGEWPGPSTPLSPNAGRLAELELWPAGLLPPVLGVVAGCAAGVAGGS